MRVSKSGRASAVGLALLLVSATAVYADQLVADADNLATESPHGSGLNANQQPGTTVAYDLSAAVKETGPADKKVFPGTVVVTIARSGDWLATNPDAGTPASFSFTAYDTNQAGTIRVTVPCGTTADTQKTMTAVLTGGQSTNGQNLNPNERTLTYNITAQGADHASCAGYLTRGFYTPVDGGWNRAKAGSGVPLMFNVWDGFIAMANEVIDPDLGPTQPFFTIRSSRIACNSEAFDPDNDIATMTAGSSSLRYDYDAVVPDASGKNVYVWKSDKGWSGTCRRVEILYNGQQIELAGSSPTTYLTADFNFFK